MVEPSGAAPFAQDTAAVKLLFNDPRPGSVGARLKIIQWASPRRHEPINTDVRKRNVRLRGLAEKGTAQRWHLLKQDGKFDIMKVPATAQAHDETTLGWPGIVLPV